MLVRIDGFEANDPASGSEFDFAQLRSTTVSGMNLLSGAAGALWGSDALAGVLDFQTLASTENRTELSLEGGERGREALALRWARARRSRALRVTLDHFETEGTNTARAGEEEDGYALQTLQLKGHRALTDQLTVTALARQVAGEAISTTPLRRPLSRPTAIRRAVPSSASWGCAWTTKRISKPSAFPRSSWRRAIVMRRMAHARPSAGETGFASCCRARAIFRTRPGGSGAHPRGGARAGAF